MAVAEYSAPRLWRLAVCQSVCSSPLSLHTTLCLQQVRWRRLRTKVIPSTSPWELSNYGRGVQVLGVPVEAPSAGAGLGALFQSRAHDVHHA